MDGERRPDWPRPLQGDHLLRGVLQPAGGRLRQRHRWRSGERHRQVMKQIHECVAKICKKKIKKIKKMHKVNPTIQFFILSIE